MPNPDVLRASALRAAEPLIAVGLPEQYRIIAMQAGSEVGVAEREREMLGFTHFDLGGVARSLELPSDRAGSNAIRRQRSGSK